MLKYSTVLSGEDGKLSPSHREAIENFMRQPISVSAGSKGGTMAMKKRGRRTNQKGDSNRLLPPIASGANLPLVLSHAPADVIQDRKENNPHVQSIPRKEIRTPYVSLGFNRMDVTTPYLLHNHVTKVDAASPILHRENSKISQGNVLEINNERTFMSLQKLQQVYSPTLERRPKAADRRIGRKLYDDEPVDQGPRLQVQSNQMGLYHRTDKKQKDNVKTKENETFSIRKKIEQFRKWHEEQNKEKIKRLKQEVDNQYEAEQHKLIRQVPPGVKSASVNENRTDRIISRSVRSEEKVNGSKDKDNEKENENDAGNDVSTTATKDRTESAKTWHTWRDVNDSYAYTDVKKYIAENELMDQEKETWIQKWISEVNKSMLESKDELL
ncbi:hypothetical protein CHS0354_018099 [Potamilus streckersoni]|uniref:Uncharacterized protein n=1 Tax=Potamilus streckersoni TaxID=2493646 RepID=A0AAE0TJM4_9BIVA|nr:hypothetical protein CHS0354_018099 [Potamilus streckersoni]